MLFNTAIITLIIKNKLKEVNALGLLYIPALVADLLLTTMFLDIMNKSFLG